MDTQEALQVAEEILKDFGESFTRPEENRLDVVMSAENLLPSVKAILLDKRWGYLSAITGLDHPEYEVDPVTNEKKIIPDQGALELLYHFCNAAAVATLRISLPYADPSIESVCGLIASASLYEREAMELFGITFRNTPNTEHLILPEDWPSGVYPLRKAFTGFEKKTKS